MQKSLGQRGLRQTITVLLGCLLVACGAPCGVAQVRGPRIVSERTPDLHDLASYVAGIIRPGLSQKERAIALWRTSSRQMYHWNNPVEYPLIKPGQFNDVTDPIRLMNVYGYTLCFCSAEGMEAVWRKAGLEAREFALPGHVTNEVWYEGQYHYLDMECKGYFPRPDGTIASARECGLRPLELVASAKLPEDFFPLSRIPFRSYLSRMVFAGLMDDGPSWHTGHRAQSGHVMHVTLRPGESYYRSWDNVGKFVNDYQRWIEPGEFGAMDCRYGPREHGGPRSFGNGVLTYEPDLTTASDEFERGVLGSRGVKKTAAGLEVAPEQADGECVFRFQVPYVICGRPGKIEEPGSSSGAVLVSIEGTGTFGLDVSVDLGRSWQRAGRGPGTFDLTRFVDRRYGYDLRVVLGPGAVLKSMRTETFFQLAHASLPALSRGDTRMTFGLGDRGEMAEWDVPLWQGKLSFVDSAWKLENVLWTGKWTAAVEPVEPKREGSVIFEVKAPPGKLLTRVTADVGGSMNNDGQNVPEDRIEVFGAAGSPAGFRSLGIVEAPPYCEHWTRRLPVSMDFPRSGPAVRQAYLRISMFRKVHAALSDLRIRYFYDDEKPLPSAVNQLVVTHGWIEGGQPRVFRKSGLKPGDSYVVSTGERFERPTFICMELPGRRTRDRELTDPLGMASFRPRPVGDFPPEAAGYPANLPLLRKLDDDGPFRSDTMVSLLIDGPNKTLAAEVRKILGFRPDERLRAMMEALLAAEPDNDRLRRGLALLDERREGSRDAFLRRYIPLLEGNSFGVRYIRRIGWTGSPGDLPALLASFGRVRDSRLRLAIAASAMLLGDSSVAREAADLASSAAAGDQILVDVLLVGAPDCAAAARDRLVKRLSDPANHVRWTVVRDMNYLPQPPKTPEALEVLARALGDSCPQVRLEAIGVLRRLDAGQPVMKRFLPQEKYPAVRDAISEALSR